MQDKTGFTKGFQLLFWPAFLLIAVNIQGCKPSNQTESVAKFGVVLPLTGEVAPYGTDCRNGIELAVAEFGGGQGRTAISALFEDSKNEARAALAATQKLINSSGVQAIIGDMGSATTLAIAPLAQESKVILLTPTAADPKIPQIGNYIFSIYPSAEEEGSFVATQIPPEQLSRVVTVRDNTEVFIAIEKGFAEGVEQRSGSVVARETLPEDASTIPALAAKVQSQNPTAVFLSGLKDNVARFAQALREQGSTAQLYSQSTMLDTEIGRQYQAALEGMLFSGPKFSEMYEDSAIAEFKKKYKAKFGKPASVWSAYGYDAAKILSKAFQTNGATPSSVAESLPGTIHNGLTGEISIGGNREVKVGMVKYQFRGGSIELLAK